jgi:hypothetical protein
MLAAIDQYAVPPVLGSVRVDEEFLQGVGKAPFGPSEPIPSDTDVVHMQGVGLFSAASRYDLHPIDLRTLPQLIVARYNGIDAIAHEEGGEAAYGYARLRVLSVFESEDPLPDTDRISRGHVKLV